MVLASLETRKESVGTSIVRISYVIRHLDMSFYFSQLYFSPLNSDAPVVAETDGRWVQGFTGIIFVARKQQYA